MCQGVNYIIAMYMDWNVKSYVHGLEGKSISMLSVPRDQESPGSSICTFSGMEQFIVDVCAGQDGQGSSLKSDVYRQRYECHGPGLHGLHRGPASVPA